MIVTMKFHYSEGSKRLTNELRCFHKHLHICEISDNLHVHCDVKHKNNMSYPAIAI